jgi:hypothetical protein
MVGICHALMLRGLDISRGPERCWAVPDDAITVADTGVHVGDFVVAAALETLVVAQFVPHLVPDGVAGRLAVPQLARALGADVALAIALASAAGVEAGAIADAVGAHAATVVLLPCILVVGGATVVAEVRVAAVVEVVDALVRVLVLGQGLSVLLPHGCGVVEA